MIDHGATTKDRISWSFYEEDFGDILIVPSVKRIYKMWWSENKGKEIAVPLVL